MDNPRNEIFGWFPPENQVILAELIKQERIVDVIEVGSFLGKSTAFFAERVDKVYAVDPFVMWEEGSQNGDAVSRGGDDFYEQFLQNMQAAGVLQKIVPVRMTSEVAAREVFNTPVDLVYIDGAHDYESVKRDIQLMAPFARKFICGDDYDTNWPGVMRAVDELYPQARHYGNLWIAP